MEFRRIIGRMNKLNLVHRILIHRAAAKNDLHFGQFPIIEYVMRNNNCTQKDISDYLQISPPSIAMSIKRMQRTGFLKKSCDEKDLRYNRITVTQKGIDAFNVISKDFYDIDKKMFNGFTEEELQLLYSFFGRIHDNLCSDEFKDKSIFNLIGEEKLLQEQIIKKEKNRD